MKRTKKHLQITRVKEFNNLFETVNSEYRLGEIENKYILFDKNFDIDNFEVEKVPYKQAVENPNLISLKDITNSLSSFAEKKWIRKQISVKNFRNLLRAMTISFEIDERFLTLSNKKRKFFKEFLKEFLKEEIPQTYEWFVLIKNYGIKRKLLPENTNEKDILDLANELILFCLCGINVRLLTHSSGQYRKGVAEIEKINHCIDAISKRKIEIETNKKKGKEVAQRQKHASGLKALSYFFKGRLYVGLNEFRHAEEMFKESKNTYFQKVNQLIFEKDLKSADSRSLAMRRANLVEIIGLVNLYYTESRIDEAFSILERVSPLLKYNSGIIMRAYSDLLKIRILRAKNSSDRKVLKKLKRLGKKCFNTFQQYVPNSHFLEYVRIEFSLICFYLAESLSTENEKKKRIHYKYKNNIYKKCLELLNHPIKYSEQRKKDGQLKNRRILVEAYSLRSHIYRNYAKFEGKSFWEEIKKAESDALKALDYAKDLNASKSEASYMLGAVNLLKYKEASREYEISLEFEEKQDNQTIKNYKDWAKEAKLYYETAQTCFYESVKFNEGENPKNEAISFLRLTELEMVKRTNYGYANFFFHKFKEIEHKVGHSFLHNYAKILEEKLKQREDLTFFIDIEADKRNLSFEYWSEKLEKFLIRQTIFYTAMERKGKLPLRKHRTDNTTSKASKNYEKTRETQQSVLAKAFRSKIGMAPNKSYEKAREYLDEFELWCIFIWESRKAGKKTFIDYNS